MLFRRRTPTMLQMESAECGATALGIVLAYWGRWITVEELRIDCSVSRDGSTAKAIAEAGRRHGLAVSAFRMEPDDLRKISLPAIVHWEMNHFLVVERFGRRVHLNDPARGPRHVSHEEFDRAFTGVALTMRPSRDFQRKGSAPSLMQALSQRLRGGGWAFGFAVAMALALIIPGLLVPLFARVYVDSILVSGQSDWLTWLLLAMGGTALAMGLVTLLQKEVLLRLETRISLLGATNFAAHVTRLPIRYFAQRHPAEVAGRIGLNDRLARLLAGEIGSALLGLMTALAYLVAVFFFSVTLGAIVFASAIANFVALALATRALVDENQRLLMMTSRQSALAKDGLGMIEAYKASGSEIVLRQRLVGLQHRILSFRQSIGGAQALLDALPVFTATTTGAIVLAYGGWKVIEGEMTLGTLVAVNALMGGFFAPLSQVVQLGSRMQDANGYLRILDDTLRHPLAPEFLARAGGGEAGGARPSGALAVENLSFAYSPIGKLVLEGINFALAPGERLGIVGASGSGKSTLGALIAGLYEPTSGTVLFDGMPLSAMRRDRLRDTLVYLDQRGFIFAATARENITLFDPSLPEERVVAAARAALIHETILERPGGYGARLAEGGADLSGGQRARIEIARAIVREPRILILDEATAALDTLTESRIGHSLRALGCTSVVIAHRPSSISDCDRVLVLDGGRIVDQGTPDELTERCAVFRSLMRDD